MKLTRKQIVEKETKQFLYSRLRENPWMENYTDEELEHYISEFCWVNNCLYVSINRLKNPHIIATLKKGLLV